jgi:hypothetical protein
MESGDSRFDIWRKLIKMEQEDIFFELAIAAKESVKTIVNWSKAILKIKRIEGNVGLESFYTLNSDSEISVNAAATYNTSLAVHELHKNMTNMFGNNSKWNRLVFTLFPDNKINIQHIWDENLQYEVDRFNGE